MTIKEASSNPWIARGVIATISTFCLTALFSFNNRVSSAEGEIKAVQVKVEATKDQNQDIKDRLKRIETKLDNYFDTHK